MTETQALLGKITALRQRLEQAQKLATEATTAATQLLGRPAGTVAAVAVLERRVRVDDEHDDAVDGIARAVTPSPGIASLPRQLTMRARRALERGRDLLARLWDLADCFGSPSDGPDVNPLFDRADALTWFYRETASMTDTALRLVHLFPETASAQLQLCEGLEAILTVIAGRLRTLAAGVAARRMEDGRVARLAAVLTEMNAGCVVDAAPLLALAEEIVADARDGGPLLLREGDPAHPAHYAACHGLTTARVIARAARDDPEWRNRPLDPVLAALLHDAGMARMPAALLSQTDPLNPEQRRLVESHCRAGAEAAMRLRPDALWLGRAVVEHHERLDGTGYPDGLRAVQLTPLGRLLAVCDVYASYCTARPYRPAKETRTALTDVLLLAENGLLDRDYAERLLELTFYPVGAAVELADGSVGMVAATPPGRRDMNGPARPVVALFTDAQGEALSGPRHIDLARHEGQSIVRSLSARERRELLAARVPEWA